MTSSSNLRKQRTFTALQGDFINTISHEIRNPLGFIRGYTTTLLREDTEWEQENPEGLFRDHRP